MGIQKVEFQHGVRIVTNTHLTPSINSQESQLA